MSIIRKALASLAFIFGSARTMEKELPRYMSGQYVSALKIDWIESEVKTELIPYKVEPGYRSEKKYIHMNVILHFEDERYTPLAVPDEYFEKYNPEPGGYYIAHSDGTHSYSSAKAFEEKYKRI